MATKKQNNLPATQQTNAVALPFEYGEDAGVGVDLTLDDLKIPFIGLLQKDSAELDSDEEKYIEGVSEGQILNKATRAAVDGETGLLLVPAIRQRMFVEWLPDRGGFVAEHLPSSDVVRAAMATGAKRNELTTEAGNELQETFSIFAIVCEEDGTPTGFCVVPFTASKISAWRDYFTQLDAAKVTRGAPLFAHTIRLTSRFVKNAKGKFYNFVMAPANGGVVDSMIAPDSPAYQAAKDLREAILAGRAQADYSTADGETGGSPSESADGHF